MIIKLILLLACASGATSSILSFSKPGNDLDALCGNKSIDLTQISQLNSLASQLEKKPGSCSERDAAALFALRDLIKANTGDECSMESHNRFRYYYKEYLDTSTKELKDRNKNLPSSLRRFALAYGVEVSGLCRANMVSILTNEAHKETDPQHLYAIRTLISKTGPLAHLLAYTGNRPDDILLPDMFVSQIKEAQNKGKDEKIGLKLDALPIIKSVQVLCERRFKPIYQPVMLPVAHMANLGFAHRGSELKKALKAAYANKETREDVAQWTRILLMCEGLDELELVESKEDKEQSEGNDSTMVSVCKRDGTCEGGACNRGDCEGKACKRGACKKGSCESGACKKGACKKGSCKKGSCEGGACKRGACKKGSCEGGACKRGSCEGGACKRGSCSGGACKPRKEADGEDLLSKIKVNADEIKPLVFKPNLSVDIPDKLIRPFDMRQVLSLAWLSTSRDEKDNVKMIFFSKHFRKLMDDLIHYRLTSFFSFMFGRIREAYRVLQRAKQHKLGQNGHSSEHIATELVKAFNSRIQELEPDLRVGEGECPDCKDLDCCCCCCCTEDCCCPKGEDCCCCCCCGDNSCCCGDNGCCCGDGGCCDCCNSDCWSGSGSSSSGTTVIMTGGRHTQYFCLSDGNTQIIIMNHSYDKKQVDNALITLVVLILIVVIIAIIIGVVHVAAGFFG